MWRRLWLAICERLACFFLGFIDPQKPFSIRLRKAIGRLKTGVAIEAVMFRKHPKTDQLQVYLRRRGPNETYPGQLHIPGSWFRPGETHEAVLARIANTDYRTEALESYATVLSHPWTTNYGESVVSEVHIVRFRFSSMSVYHSAADWYDVESIGDYPVIDAHRFFIEKAAAMHRKRTQTRAC